MQRLRDPDNFYGLQIMEEGSSGERKDQCKLEQGFSPCIQDALSCTPPCLSEHPAVTALIRKLLEAT